MKRIICLFAALALLTGGCTKNPVLPGPPRPERLTGRARDPRPDTTRTAGPHLYVTAVVFAEDYDWKTDSLPEARGAQILLLKDGEEVLRVPAGESLDPGRHRVQGGHLYQDGPSGQETVLLKDGKEVLRFAGQAALKGFLAAGDTLHSLWQFLDGGIAYRVDRELRYEDPSGVALGADDAPERPLGSFSLDGKCLYYSYYVPVRSGDGLLREYRTMQGAVPFHTLPAGNVFEAGDIRVVEGVVYRIERRTAGTPALSFVQGKDIRNLPAGEEESASAGRLVVDGGRVLARYRLSGPEGTRLVVSDGNQILYAPEGRIREFCLEGEEAAWLVSGRSGIEAICRTGREPLTPWSGLTLPSGRCMQLRDGHLFLALTGNDGRHHCLYIDEKAVSYSFNGYFSSVEWE